MNERFKSTGFTILCVAAVAVLLIAAGAFCLPGLQTVVAEGRSSIVETAVPVTKDATKAVSGACAGLQDGIRGMAGADDEKDAGKSKKTKAKAKAKARTKAKKSSKKSGGKSSR